VRDKDTADNKRAPLSHWRYQVWRESRESAARLAASPLNQVLILIASFLPLEFAALVFLITRDDTRDNVKRVKQNETEIGGDV